MSGSMLPGVFGNKAAAMAAGRAHPTGGPSMSAGDPMPQQGMMMPPQMGGGMRAQVMPQQGPMMPPPQMPQQGMMMGGGMAHPQMPPPQGGMMGGGMPRPMPGGMGGMGGGMPPQMQGGPPQGAWGGMGGGMPMMRNQMMPPQGGMMGGGGGLFGGMPGGAQRPGMGGLLGGMPPRGPVMSAGDPMPQPQQPPQMSLADRQFNVRQMYSGQDMPKQRLPQQQQQPVHVSHEQLAARKMMMGGRG
jgi:hypothetical protein